MVNIDVENIVGQNGMRVKNSKLDETHDDELVYDEPYEDWKPASESTWTSSPPVTSRSLQKTKERGILI